MFDFLHIINLAMLYLLDILHGLTGSYGLAIVTITVLMRTVLWPMNTAQTKSMKKMQELQPKIKQLQERYKDNPQKMQEAMMKFYAENKFNPFAGCLPMLVQIPIFIGLYGALNSPEFLSQAGGEQFLFIQKLHHTLQSHAGESLDQAFNVQENDKFSTARTIKLDLKNGKTKEITVKHADKALEVRPQPILPGEPITITLNLEEVGLTEEYSLLIDRVEAMVIDAKTRELENLTFKPQSEADGGQLTATIPTVEGKNTVHMDVFMLIVLYGLMTMLYQRLMQKGSASKVDGPQGQMMKLMPLMFVVMLFFIPIPAGVMIYLVVTMLLMYLQTWWVYFQEHRQEDTPKPSTQVVDVKSNS